MMNVLPIPGLADLCTTSKPLSDYTISATCRFWNDFDRNYPLPLFSSAILFATFVTLSYKVLKPYF